mmetsp:Transcript_16674/g.30197  ORF Transcript_16674/g.30197 Transcript_16674/m.30197 type:complete len:81 (-) Transcript_16674:1326-1568(-)
MPSRKVLETEGKRHCTDFMVEVELRRSQDRNLESPMPGALGGEKIRVVVHRGATLSSLLLGELRGGSLIIGVGLVACFSG